MGRRGLVGLFTTHRAKGEGSNPGLSLSFNRFQTSREEAFVTRKNVRAQKGPATKRVASAGEKPAGVSGMVMRKAFGLFRRRLND